TTEVHKVPATILSRVQRFDFKPIPASEIAEQIQAICKAEKVTIEEPAVKRLARLANGSMRDALSLLDQVLSMAGKKITSQVVDEFFPAAHDEVFAELIDRLAENDAARALDVVDRSLSGGATLDNWCSQFIAQLRDLMILRVCGDDTDLVDAPAALRSDLAAQCRKFDSGAYVYMISMLEELRRSTKSNSSGRALVEAAIIRMADASNFSSVETLLSYVGNGAPAGGAGPSRSAPTPSVPASRSILSTSAAPRPSTVPEKKNEVAEAFPSVSAEFGEPPVASPASSRRPLVGSVDYLPTTGDEPSAPPPARKHREVETSPGSAAPGGGLKRRTTQEDLRAAQADPLVMQAMELFGGQIVEVSRNRQDRPGPLESEIAENP
ncbi:MAG TPA: hypothetical protein VNT79_05790, partial [Phycisphaerae bacterium]|nr:hypothetical protein [Phycisphaerae bacterium]